MADEGDQREDGATQPSYSVGDRANGHVWTGQEWIALNPGPSSLDPARQTASPDGPSSGPSPSGNRNGKLAGLLVAGVVVAVVGVVLVNSFKTNQSDGPCGDSAAYQQRLTDIQAATSHASEVSRSHREEYDASANPTVLLAEKGEQWRQENVDSWTSVAAAFDAAVADDSITGPAHAALVHDAALAQAFLDASRAGGLMPTTATFATDGAAVDDLVRACAA